MAPEKVVQQLVDSTRTAGSNAFEETLMGLFQVFRPDGLQDHEFLDEHLGGADFRRRLSEVYDAVRSSVRRDGLKDAYFVVRDPRPIGSTHAEPVAAKFVESALEAAKQMQLPRALMLTDSPIIRILEGKPPKHPKAEREQADLLQLLQKDLPSAVDASFAPESLGGRLQEALYFVACDTWLRDYLRLPLLGAASSKSLEVACGCYFQLWRHGIKFRIFSDNQIDFYLPRRDDGTLIDAGQFASRN
ncbi:MAG: hypothetical protein AB8B50_07775 [Pirellulaceae bacterium]